MTESVAAADPRLTITVLSHLKHMGIGVILDDFGIGSSSLSGRRQFPVDALKIDRSLVREMQTDRGACDMVEVIITLAHKMNLRVIAEGIETARQLERLRRTGMRIRPGILLLPASGSEGRAAVSATAGCAEEQRSRRDVGNLRNESTGCRFLRTPLDHILSRG